MLILVLRLEQYVIECTRKGPKPLLTGIMHSLHHNLRVLSGWFTGQIQGY